MHMTQDVKESRKEVVQVKEILQEELEKAPQEDNNVMEAFQKY